MNIDATYAKQQRKAVAEQLPNAVPAADAARLAGFEIALAVQAAQQSSLTVDRARKAAKYGATSDQVQAADARLEAGAEAIRATQLSQTRAQLQAPAVPEASAGIFGRVVDASGDGVGKATVSAINPSGARSGKAASAADGSFQMTIPVRSATKTRAKSSDNAAAKSSITVHLQVTIGDKTILVDDETLTLHAGDIVLRELSVTPPAKKR